MEEQNDEDAEEHGEEEEDKADGSTQCHATVVADLAETRIFQGSPRENEKLESEGRNQANQAKTRAWATTETSRRRECLPATEKSEIKRIMTIGAGQEDQETNRTCETSRKADNNKYGHLYR